MLRPRALDRWSNLHQYSNADEFLTSKISNGVHSIAVGNQFLDLLVVDRGAPTTLVVFNAKLSGRAKTTPSLQGVSLSRDVGTNLVAVSDPTIGMGDIDVAWYLGNSEIGTLPPALGPLIRHTVLCLNSRRTILFGSSGGGFGAYLHGGFIEDCIVLMMNPRTILTAAPKADLETYNRVAMQTRAENEDPVDVVKMSLIPQYKADSLPFDVCLYQNLGDRTYFFHQSFPLLKHLQSSPRMYVRADWDAAGHHAPPADKLRRMLKLLARRTDQNIAITSAGFLSVNYS